MPPEPAAPEVPPKRALGRNVTANVLNALSSVGTTLIATPLILGDLGLSALGVWTLAQTLVLYLVTADAGIGPAVVRFTALHVGRGRREEVARLMWSTLAFYGAIGAVAVLLAQLLSSRLTSLFEVPTALQHDARTMFSLTGLIVLVALSSVALANVLQGLERFDAVAVTSASASVAFLIVLPVALSSGAGLPGVALAALCQQAVGAIGRVWCLRDVIRLGRPRLLERDEAGEIARFAGRLQLSVLSALVGTQSDKVVVGLVSTTRTVGEVGIAAQIADGGRIVCGAALGPFTSRMAMTFGAGDAEGLRALYARLTRVWLVLVTGGTIIGGLSLAPLIEAWLGEDPGRTSLYATLLVAGAGLHLATGVASSYLRAIGRPNYEVVYGAIIIFGNVVLSVALGLLTGPVGVVAATPITYGLGAVWILRRMEPDAPGTGGLVIRTLIVSVPWALGVGLVGAVATRVVAAHVPSGVALVPAGLVIGLCLVAYLCAVFRARPTPGAMRAAIA